MSDLEDFLSRILRPYQNGDGTYRLSLVEIEKIFTFAKSLGAQGLPFEDLTLNSLSPLVSEYSTSLMPTGEQNPSERIFEGYFPLKSFLGIKPPDFLTVRFGDFVQIGNNADLSMQVLLELFEPYCFDSTVYLVKDADKCYGAYDRLLDIARTLMANVSVSEGELSDLGLVDNTCGVGLWRMPGTPYTLVIVFDWCEEQMRTEAEKLLTDPDQIPGLVVDGPFVMTSSRSFLESVYLPKVILDFCEKMKVVEPEDEPKPVKYH